MLAGPPCERLRRSAKLIRTVASSAPWSTLTLRMSLREPVASAPSLKLVVSAIAGAASPTARATPPAAASRRVVRDAIVTVFSSSRLVLTR